MSKTLVLYVFHIYNDRVQHFINNCIFYDENVDFIMISNDKNNIFEVPNYVKTLFRDNIGFDFGGWSDALLTNNFYKNYNNFIFVNSSVIGPFLPNYFKHKWVDIYLNGLQNNIKLFGSTINTMGVPLYASHVQSYIFSMDKFTLLYLIGCGIFTIRKFETILWDVVLHKEILMSRKIIENNWNIGSLMKYYENVDFTFKNKTPEECNIQFLDDIMYPEYKNVIWHDYEIVFIKGNRIV
jgi:hypothetical protein